VALLIKAAYDDATEAARAAFMARVKPMPTSTWPWSAVQALAPRAATGVGRIGGVTIAPPPGAPITPPPKIELAPLPRAADVSGDLSRNWGETPVDLRPLFMLMEETSRIVGAAGSSR
jgi:hypothetical protein